MAPPTFAESNGNASHGQNKMKKRFFIFLSWRRPPSLKATVMNFRNYRLLFGFTFGTLFAFAGIFCGGFGCQWQLFMLG